MNVRFEEHCSSVERTTFSKCTDHFERLRFDTIGQVTDVIHSLSLLLLNSLSTMQLFLSFYSFEYLF